MRNTLKIVLLSLFFFYGCKNMVYDKIFKHKGIYDESIHLETLENDDKEIIFFPIHHLGRDLFYKDVKKKVDSLKKEGYYFFKEQVTGPINDTITIRKFRKVSGLPQLKNGYRGWADSILKIKLKKKLVNQPTYKSWGLDSINSLNADVTLKTMINYYENKYDTIQLDSCDLNTPITKITSCKDYDLIKIFKKEVIIDFRNDHVLEELRKNKHKKIAIIYGKNHFSGIKKKLLEQGFHVVK